MEKEKFEFSEPRTIGEHLKRKRLRLGLSQAQLARELGVHQKTIANWERNRSSPTPHYMAKVIEFLGYLPCQLKAETLPEKIRLFRIVHGLSQKDLAKILRVGPSTIMRWEKGEGKPTGKLLRLLDTFSASQFKKSSK